MTHFINKFDYNSGKFFGETKDFSLEHQCFNGMCLFTAVLFFISVALNFLIDLPPGLIFSSFAFGTIFTALYLLSRFKGLFYPCYWVALACGCMFVDTVWFYSGGIAGPSTIISLSILAMISLITAGTQCIVAVVILCLNLGALYMAELVRPDLIIEYKTDSAKFFDNYFTFTMGVLIISFVVHFTMQHFRSEKKKVRENEERLKAILNNLSDMAWLKGKNSDFTLVNRPFCEACGLSAGEIIGKKAHEVWPDSMAQQILKDDATILRTGQSLKREQIINHHSKGKIRLEIVKKPLTGLNGEISGIVGTASDITARYEYEDRLKKYERIVATSIDMMALVNREYRYEAANNSYLEAHGLNEEEIVGSTVAEIKGEKVFENTIKHYMDKAFQGEVVSFQNEFMYKGIGRRYIETSYFPHKNDQGDTVSIVIHIRDLTDKKQMEQRLIQSEKMEAIGTLAGGIAHDFNNILSGIIGYAQLGKININKPEKLNRHLDQILKGAGRAGDLVRQILTFSRQYDYEKQPLEIGIIIKEALKLIRASIPSFIEIRENIVSESLILADPSQIHQIIMNLCTNAYHAMQETKGCLSLSLKDLEIAEGSDLTDRFNTYIPPGKYIELEVSDTGQGIDEQVLEKVFDPYFTTKEMGKGTGLGLALVHGIVEEHSGFIQVESSPGHGSVFRIFFPLIESVPELEPDSEEKNELLSGSGEKLMIVDDETSILFSTKELLEDLGYGVDVFQDGLQAFSEFKKSPNCYDLVITDMTMPKMTGDELAKEILKIRPGLPIVLCTGYSDRITEEKAFETGICEFIQKPLNSHDLTSLIRKILKKNSE
jgi:PAS domain S-box-containing protein